MDLTRLTLTIVACATAALSAHAQEMKGQLRRSASIHGRSHVLLGDHPPGSHLPSVSDDAGTPFAVVVIPVDDKLAIKP